MADEVNNMTRGSLLIIEGSQNGSSCDVNHESQQPDEQLGASWFSPPITSTQIVSFDLLSLDDSQDELISGKEKQNILVDLSSLSSDELITSDEIMQFTNPAHLLALSPLCDQTNVSETPPPQGESINWDNRNVTDYLFNNSELINAGSSVNNISIPIIKAPTKRLSTQVKSKKQAKIKKPKIEGYSCKLNGTMYQVLSRDLDVLEAIERGLKDIQEKIRQKGVCNVRPICLQLNQIETLLDILDDDQLELGMPLEAWNEMMALTKIMFHNTQEEVYLCKKRRLELDTCTDELTTSFSHSFNISSSKQTKQKSSEQLLVLNRDKNTEENLVRNPDISSHFESQVLRTNTTAEIEQEKNEIQIIGTSYSSNNTITEESVHVTPQQTSTKTTVRKGRPPKSKNKCLKKKSSKKSYSPNIPTREIFEERHQSILNQHTSIDNFPSPGGDLNRPFAEDSTFDIDLSMSQRISAISRTDLYNPVNESNLETSPNTFSSIHNANESILASQENYNVNGSQLNPVRATNNYIHSSQQIEEIVIAENTQPTDYQEESFTAGASLNLTLPFFRGKGGRMPKIVMMNFNLRPYLLKGILSPGKNNMKMNINNRVYIASLLPDGTIEMNGFSFPTIGNWIKSVEGKRFGELSRMVQKTLELQYSGKPLEDVLGVGEKLNRSLLKGNDEIPHSNPTLQSSKTNNNISLEAVSVAKNPIQIPTLDPITVDELAQKNPIPNTDMSLNTQEDLQLIPDEMTRHIKTIFLHAPDEYFPICQCFEQFWCGAQPFPKHLLDEVDSW